MRKLIMKQKIALFIATMVLALSITACRQNGDGVSNETSTVAEETIEQMTAEETEMVAVQSEQTESVDVEDTEVNEYGFDVYANADKVTFGDPIKENFEYSGGHESAYLMPIFLDGNDYNIYAIFVAEGNLINIDDTSSKMPKEAYVYTWGVDVDYKQ